MRTFGDRIDSGSRTDTRTPGTLAVPGAVLSYTVIGEKLDCDCKTVDNALQRVKRKVGSHLQSRAVLL